MKKVLVLFVMFGLSVFIVSCGKQTENYFLSDYAKKFQNEFNNYSRQIDENPTKSEAYRQRREIRERIGDYKGLLKISKKQLNLMIKNYQLYYSKAMLENTLVYFERGHTEFDKVLEISPKNFRAYRDRGRVKERIGDYEGALAD
jgi:tetratricopeptide (TPR) repeat protein